MTKYLLKISVFILTATATYAQVWHPVGNGLGLIPGFKTHVSSDIYNGEVYVAYSNKLGPSYNTIVEVWNGVSWNSLPALPSSSFSARDILVVNDTVYLAGDDVSNNGVILYTFDGMGWTGHTTTNLQGWATYVGQYNGDIIVGGAITVGSIEKYLVKFDGTNFLPFGNIEGTTSINQVYNTVVFNNELYAGTGSGTSSSFTDAIRKYDTVSDSWSSPVQFLQGTSSTSNDFKLITYNGKLYAAEASPTVNTELFEVKGDSLLLAGQIDHTVSDFTIFNSILYMVGDPVMSGTISMSRYNGVGVSPVLGSPANLGAVESINNKLYTFSAKADILNGLDYNYAFQSALNNVALLKGQFYKDANNNCQPDAAEKGLSFMACSVNGNNFNSDSKGYYSVVLPPGTYQLDSLSALSSLTKNYEFNCSFPGPVTVSGNQTITQNVAVANNVPVDAQVFITPWRGFSARYGFREVYQLDFGNAGNTAINQATVRVTIPSSVSLDVAVPSPATINGDTLTYHFTNLPPDSVVKALIQVRIDTAGNVMGDSLTFRADIISGVPGDADISDNSDVIKQVISGAFDPNDKSVSHERILPHSKYVDYHIRFQNTGNDTARKVTVVDTLDITLPLTKVVIKSASHPYQLRVVGSTLIWEFDNIMLPDSTTDYIGSQGYVRFSAGINPSLSVGDTIDNDAEIYFDYQHPVHTNHAKTVIVSNISLVEAREEHKLQVYPNPARDIMHIRNMADRSQELVLRDVSGQKLKTINIAGMTEVSCDMSSLPVGVYFLSSQNETYRIIRANQ
ncbi:MAG TPA: hypothetical protein DCG19_14430 [Cryomorphaceae bacterium]|nr:hypothetical protein [Owenweeksia sp.]MBF99047.1 hypothetical protein [Owenweeksia sp.]HAD98604.1 hypothetical protein [Cryomorphaceae bacterium]|tara:strand:+ start:2213 stop:4591 length:2379 start_codon:yes stop_codon:yes gene_type:complete